MKTDLIEIFQTIRAELQPYATLGFTNRTNSEEKYDLWSEKNLDVDGEKRSETFFVSLEIKDGNVTLDLLPEGVEGHQDQLLITKLDDTLLNSIDNKVAAGYKIFKEQEWI